MVTHRSPCPICRATPEPLREGALVFAPIAAQATGKMLYKPLIGLPVPPGSLRHGPPQPLPRLPISVNLILIGFWGGPRRSITGIGGQLSSTGGPAPHSSHRTDAAGFRPSADHARYRRGEGARVTEDQARSGPTPSSARTTALSATCVRTTSHSSSRSAPVGSKRKCDEAAAASGRPKVLCHFQDASCPDTGEGIDFTVRVDLAVLSSAGGAPASNEWQLPPSL
jgi:hypothetical protein